ncbi:septal ring lytic transglycosylase RlpA family protein [Rhodoferax sp.]|uniref:septal ring lytic transglycosylase RlpA family protein n=1 Tax=Rhodoferax sp. TaxID=50421 RepID=UPI00374D703F
MFEKRLCVFVLLAATLLGCAAQVPAPADAASEVAPGSDASDAPASSNAATDFWATDLGSGAAQRGRASWYGKRFHGRRTASGEIFKMSELTAAHRTLPLLSYAKVTLLSTGKSIIVRINDRGPHILTHRIIDLSQAAAKELGLLAMGTADVLVERVIEGKKDDASAPGPNPFSLSNK